MRCLATTTFTLVLLCALSASGAAQAPPNPASPPIDLDAKLKEQQQSIATDTQGKIDALEGKIRTMIDKAATDNAQGRVADQRSIGSLQSSVDQLRKDVEQLKKDVTTATNSIADLTKQDSTWTMVRLWIAALAAPFVTALGFIFVYQQLGVSNQQARTAAEQANTAAENLKLATKAADRATTEAAEEQTWKKAQFLADRVKDFQADKVVEYVIHALDFRDRVMTIEKYGKDPILFVHDQAVADEQKARDKRKTFFEPDKKHVILAQALRYHEDADSDFDQYEDHVRDDFDWFFFRLGQFEPMIESKLFSYEEFEIHLRYVLDLVSGGKKHVSTTLAEKIHTYVKKYDFAGVEALIARRQAARSRGMTSTTTSTTVVDPSTPAVATEPVPTSN